MAYVRYTYNRNSGIRTIWGSVVVITVIDLVEGVSQTELVRVKPAIVTVARVMHDHWCITFVCVNPSRTNTENIESLPFKRFSVFVCLIDPHHVKACTRYLRNMYTFRGPTENSFGGQRK